MKTNGCVAALLLLASGLLPISAAAQTSDIVHMTNGRQIRGEIDTISATEISLNVRGAPQQIPVVEVDRITFSREPTQLRQARDRIRTGQLLDALLSLNQINRQALDRESEFIETDIEFYTAYCQAKLALSMGTDLTPVSLAMFKFINDHADSYHYFQAVETLGDLAMALEKYGGAIKYYRRLAKAPWPALRMRGELLEARALRSDGKYGEAVEKYERVAAAQLSTPDANRMQTLARVGRAACQAELGQGAEAVKSIEQIIAENDSQDTELFASAYNALGACFRQMNQPQDALLAYLHVDLLFYQVAGDHAESLYHLGNLWSQMRNPQRAEAARRVLKTRYPGSRWAKL
jgi:tetratricopeptide (TPR) repeat protein